MNFGEILLAFFGAVAGGGGVTSLCVWFFRRYLEKRLSAAEKRAEIRRKKARQGEEIDDRLHHAYGRMFFWVNRALVTGEVNGELKNAFDELQRAETERKEFMRSAAASAITDDE